MKKILLLLSIFIVANISAQTFDRVAKKHWKGASQATASFTTSGKVYLTQDISFEGTANSISGTTNSTMNLDGTIYKCKVSFKGSFTYAMSGSKLTISSCRVESGDPLPHGLNWLCSTGTLTFYQNGAKYKLKGTLTGPNNEANQLSLDEE